MEGEEESTHASSKKSSKHEEDGILPPDANVGVELHKYLEKVWGGPPTKGSLPVSFTLFRTIFFSEFKSWDKFHNKDIAKLAALSTVYAKRVWYGRVVIGTIGYDFTLKAYTMTAKVGSKDPLFVLRCRGASVPELLDNMERKLQVQPYSTMVPLRVKEDSCIALLSKAQLTNSSMFI